MLRAAPAGNPPSGRRPRAIALRPPCDAYEAVTAGIRTRLAALEDQRESAYAADAEHPRLEDR
ncbi:hypothetical protein Aab01nite_81110 [Paractinoplanes abujensis]|nr:hypothetical protein Aab01nite_81110 [Actinoplanes abujensis]